MVLVVANVRAEHIDGYWRVVDSDGRQYNISPIAGFKQQGGRFVTGKGDVTAYGWDEMTRMPSEWTAQLVAGVLQLWVDESAARERAAEHRQQREMTHISTVRDALSTLETAIKVFRDNDRVMISYRDGKALVVLYEWAKGFIGK